MSKVQKWLSVTAVALLTLTQFLFLSPNPAFACSCVQSDSVEAERDMATAVFAGKVTHLGIVQDELLAPITFQVSEVWKGPEQTTLVIYSPTDSAACGYPFSLGQEYLVYAGRNSDIVWWSTYVAEQPL